MTRLSRRHFLSGAAAAVALGTLPREAGAGERPSSLAIEEQTFYLPDLDEAHEGLKVVQLSDIHVGIQTGEAIVQAAVDAANAQHPDLVVLTGDYLVHSKSGVGRMREQLGGLKAPTVAILGNHDHWVDQPGAKAALEKHGYAVLQNEHESITLRGERFTLVGIDDQMTGHADVKKSFAGAPQRSRLILAHVPHTIDQIAALGEPGLCLSGHTHGGQVAVPGLTKVLMRVMLRGERFQRGRYREGTVQLYVNRGIGLSGFPVRVNSTPELTVATLRRPKPPTLSEMMFGLGT